MSNVTIKTDIKPATILKARGLGESTRAQRFLAQTVANLSDPYVPMSAGAGIHMKNFYTIPSDGSEIVYRGPYAHFQYVGEVMVGTKSGSPWAQSGEPKKGTGRALMYHGGPMRGKEWDKRMLADKKKEIEKVMAKFVGGKAK